MSEDLEVAKLWIKGVWSKTPAAVKWMFGILIVIAFGAWLGAQ